MTCGDRAFRHLGKVSSRAGEAHDRMTDGGLRHRVCQRLSHVEGFRLRQPLVTVFTASEKASDFAGGRHGSIIGRGFVGHVDGQIGGRGATRPTSPRSGKAFRRGSLGGQFEQNGSVSATFLAHRSCLRWVCFALPSRLAICTCSPSRSFVSLWEKRSLKK